MRFMRGFCLLWLLAVSVAWAQFDFPGVKPARLGRARATKARLVLSHETAKPGDTVTAAVELTMDPGWHTYWRNGGDSGEATELHWALPTGIVAGEIQWPVPEKLIDRTAGETITYVYQNRAVLLVSLKIAANAPVGTHELSTLVKWLECKESCIPGSNLVSARLTIGTTSQPGAETNLFAEAERLLPAKPLPGNVTAKWDQPANATNRAFIIEWNTAVKEPDFFPFTNGQAEVSAKTTVLVNSGSNVVLRATAKRFAAAWPQQITGLLTRQENGATVGHEVTLTLGDAASDSALAAQETKSLWVWLAYAFIGGLILNIMPCVLPVIALKILGFVNQSREDPRRVRTLGLFYTLGVIASFLVLAGIVIGVKAAGQKAGWGMQFSNPQFIVILTVIVTLVALNLFGVFEITLSGSAMGAASQAASGHGGTGAFMNGVLATALATPCTAPFLGASLGFAFAQPPLIIVLFFATIGLGLALPYLLLSWNPRWLKFLPKPGAWMEHFKIAMGFPMLATAVWLFTLTTDFYRDRVLWLGLFLIVVACAAWVFGQFVQRGGRRRGVAVALVLLLLIGGYAYAIESQLRWRSPVEDTAAAMGEDTFQESPDGIVWRRWSEAAVAKARAEGRPVFVDFTAKWCLTCKLNKNSSIEIPSVRAKLKEINAVALLADHTKYPPAIAAELEKFGRAGVPLVLVYPKDASRPPLILPEVLTPSIMLHALDEAAK